MKRIYFYLILPIFVLFFSPVVLAQTENKPFSVTLHGGLNEYFGDFGNGFLNLKQVQPLGAVSLAGYLSPSINFGLQGSYGNYGYEATKGSYAGQSFFGKKIDASMFVEYKFNNGYLLSKACKLSPFVSLGVGFADYRNVDDRINVFPMDFIVPMGAGLKYHITDAIAVQYKYLYNLTNDDQHDMIRVNQRYDKFGQHLVGFGISFGKKKKEPLETVIIPSLPDYPDRDGDGVPDHLDKCPDIPGPAWNDGCPEDVTEMIQLLGKIEFEFDSQVIKVESFPMLDHAYNVLKANPEYKLVVEGHTDNIGDEAYNQDLSERRAKSVYNYLTIKGIEPYRVIANGYGSTRPIADNSTPEGRAKNRRIEFRVEL